MPMTSRTVRIFDKDAYLTRYKGNIVSCEREGDCYSTVLDATIFFPEQGGQSPDKGQLGGQDVVDVRNNDGIIYHVTREMPKDGQCIVDWQHRFSNMQQHTGEHIFSGLAFAKYGYENVGFHLSDHVVTLDTSGPLSEAQITELEDEVNKVITEDHAVKAFFPAPEKLDEYAYRSKDGIEGDVRLVEIEGVDLCACCAPHVKSTGEIGIFKIVGFESYKGGMRLTFLCGARALEEIRRNESVLKSLSAEFSCGKDNIIDNIEKLKNEKTELLLALRNLEENEANRMIEGLPVDITSPLLFTRIKDTRIIRDSVNRLTQQYDGFAGIFFGEDGKYQFVIGSREKNCNKIMEEYRKTGAKGGGSDKMVQGSLKMTESAIREIWNNKKDI